jgi:hypothetical protein
MMKAANFELRHRTLLHQVLVAAAFITYLFDPDDIVWRFVRNSAAPHQQERAIFILATISIAVGACLSTWARATAASVELRRPQSFLGDFLYSIGLASLFPLPGFLILVCGEGLLILRLIGRANGSPKGAQYPSHSSWSQALRKEAVKWGILITMIVFSITLTDRLAEYLAATSFLIGLLLNAPFFSRSSPD